MSQEILHCSWATASFSLLACGMYLIFYFRFFIHPCIANFMHPQLGTYKSWKLDLDWTCTLPGIQTGLWTRLCTEIWTSHEAVSSCQACGQVSECGPYR